MDGVNSGVKWTCPNIYQLVKILDTVHVDKILVSVFDKRLTKIEDLTVIQLRQECMRRHICSKGNKV